MVERAPVPNGLGSGVPGPDPVALDALPRRGKLLLRGGNDVVAAAGGVIGHPLPTVPLTSVASEGRTALWLGPDEWLLLCSPDETDALGDALRHALAGTFHAIVDVTERFAGFVVSGPRVRDVLAAGCPIDLHPRAFKPGTVVRTLLGKVDVILWSTGDDTFTLLVGRSFAPYTGRFLTNAALEFGVVTGNEG